MEYQEWQRSYLGYRERFVDAFELSLPNGRSISVRQAPSPGKGGANYREEGDPMVTGTTVWDAGIMLSMYLAASPPPDWAREPAGDGTAPVIVELGTGTGLVSLAAAGSWRMASGCIVATDIPAMIPFIEDNIRRNARALRPMGNDKRIHAFAMRWANEEDIVALRGRHGADVRLVVGSDILYSEQTPQGALILATLRALCSPDTVVLIAAHKHHNAALVDAFIAEARGVFGAVDIITDRVPQQWVCQDGVLIRLTRIQPLDSLA